MSIPRALTGLACAMALAIGHASSPTSLASTVKAAGRLQQSSSAQADPRWDALSALIKTRMEEHGVPGLALGVFVDGKSFTRGFGITNVEDPLPVTTHTVFPIASISKTFAATAALRLVEQGKLDLKVPIRKYLPDFRVRDERVSNEVTMWHLLTHTGGWEGQVSGPDRGEDTLRNFVGSIADLMQVAPPEAAWSYNNAGFSIAGRVMEVITGQSINRVMRELVFQPLALEHAGTTAGDFIVQRFAAGHTRRDNTTTLNRPFSPATSVTAGGIGLCIEDLLRYGAFHLTDGRMQKPSLLTPASLQLLRTPQLAKQSTDDHIGIGWHLRQVGGLRTASHGGTLSGHILLLEIVPERNFAIAILTNANTGWRVIQDVEREALKSYLGVSYARNQGIAHRGLVETLPWVEPTSTQPDPAPYAGTYLRPGNSVIVRASSGKLVVQDVPNGGKPGAETPIAFFGPDRAIVTEGVDRGQTIEFVRDSTGRVNWVRVVGRVAVRTQ